MTDETATIDNSAEARAELEQVATVLDRNNMPEEAAQIRRALDTMEPSEQDGKATVGPGDEPESDVPEATGDLYELSFSVRATTHQFEGDDTPDLIEAALDTLNSRQISTEPDDIRRIEGESPLLPRTTDATSAPIVRKMDSERAYVRDGEAEIFDPCPECGENRVSRTGTFTDEVRTMPGHGTEVKQQHMFPDTIRCTQCDCYLMIDGQRVRLAGD